MFGLAILPSWGGYSDPAVTWVILGLIVVCVLFWSIGIHSDRGLPAQVIAPLTWAGVLWLGSGPMWFPQPALYITGDFALGQSARWGLWAMVLTYGLALEQPEPRWLRNVRFTVIAGMVGVLGAAMISASPEPIIDVWTVQQKGAEIFVGGGNPFQDVHLKDTGPRTAEDVPYVYPPLHLYVSSVVWKLLGDVRFGAVLALILLGFAARALGRKVREGEPLPAVIEDAPALFVWCTPMLPFIIEQGWIDPLQVCWCSALFLAWGRPWLMSLLAGLVLGAKQTMMFLVAPVGLSARLKVQHWVLVGVVGLIPLLPWLIWDFHAYKHANFDFLSALPVRDDALTVVTWAQRRLHLHIPYVIGFIGAFGAIGLAAWRGKQPIGSAAITALTAMTLLFTFNKWAFANYYFTLLSLAAIAAAASLSSDVKPLVLRRKRDLP